MWRCLKYNQNVECFGSYSPGEGGGKGCGDVWGFQGMVVLVLVLSTHMVWVGFVYVQMF